MNGLSRRSFLRAVVAGCAASTVSGSVLSSLNAVAQNCGVFNVVLHGLFVIDIAAGYVQISSPDCTNLPKHSHVYRAGSWADSKSYFKDVRGSYEPIWPIPYANAVIRDMPILKSAKMGKPNHKMAYLSLILPTPNAITGLRNFDKSEVNYPADYMDATKFPLVTVLTYNSAPTFPPIPDTPWDSTNYHIFAEPEEPMDCTEAADHGKTVIKLLWAMFKTNLTAGPMPKGNCTKLIDVHPAARCVLPEHERALSELGSVTTSERPAVPEQHITSQSRTDHATQLELNAVHMPTCAVFVAP